MAGDGEEEGEEPPTLNAGTGSSVGFWRSSGWLSGIVVPYQFKLREFSIS
jgi:hypothetical protein